MIYYADITTMLKHNRQLEITDYVTANNSATLADLVDLTRASKLTIQRDLVELENQGKLKRVHGGAITNQQKLHGTPKSVREKENVQAKILLARYAAGLINGEDTVAIDTSTTCSYLADAIPDIDINIVTPSIDTFLKLSQKEHVTPILPGGQLNPRTQNLVGNFAAGVISQFRFSLCFISADGFDPERGSLEYDLEDSIIKKVMIDVSEKVVLVIDSSKTQRHKGIQTCPLEKIVSIITDKEFEYPLPEDVGRRVNVIGRSQ